MGGFFVLFGGLLVMIVRPRHHWFRLLFVWRGSVLPDVIGRMLLVLMVSVISVMCRDSWVEHFPGSALSIPPFTLMGIALAIFLGFRNSVSYDRFWEARKQWGAILVAARALMRQFNALVPNAQPEERDFMARRLAAFAYALKHQLRKTDARADLSRYLAEDELARLVAVRFGPEQLLAILAGELANLARAGRVSEMAWQSLDRTLNTLGDASGACERIASTPIPYTYRVLMNRTVMVYCSLLPIGLSTSIGWLTPLIATFVAYTFLALEMIGEQIEEPFGTEPNDLPLDSLCHTIELSVCELAGLPALGQAPVPRNYVLT